MKNTQTPRLLDYVKSLAFMLAVSVAFSGAFSMKDSIEFSNPLLMLQYVPVAFVSVFLLNLVLGPIISKGLPKGIAKNDSLVINDTTYSGTFAPYYITPALFSMDTVNKGCIYVKDGIKKKHTIGKLDFSSPLQPRVATPTQSGGNITIDGNVLEPKDMMVYQEFNPRDLELHWSAEELSNSLLTRQLPPTLENYLMLLITGRAFEQFEVGIWMGSLNYANNVNVPPSDPRYQLQFFDGLLKKMIADSAVYKTAGAVTLTASNIGTALQDLYATAAANNKALIANPRKYQRMKFLVSINTAVIYEDFLTTQPFKNNNTTEKGINQYKGFEVVALAGLADNTIVFTESLAATDGNLWFGINSQSDENLQLMRVQNNSEMFFFKMLFKADTNYGWANKAFIYTTLTSADFTA